MNAVLPLASGLRAGELVQLARLGGPQVRSAVAGHPNAPGWLLAELAGVFPAQVLRNPALPLLRLADPGLLEGWPARSVEQLAAQPDAPLWLLRLAARHPVIDVQLAAVVHSDLPVEVLERLAQSPFWTIREYVARKSVLPLATLLALAHDADYGVRLSVAGRDDLPDEVRRVLRHDLHPLVRAVIHLFDLNAAQKGGGG